MKTLVLAFAVFPLFIHSQSLTVPANGTHRFTTSTIQLDELIVGPNAILSFQTDEREVVFKCRYVKIGEGVMINGKGGMGSSGESPSNGDSGSDCRSGEPGRAGGAGERGGNGLAIRIETESFSFEPFVVDVSGGAGGKGGNGGNGGKGGNATCDCNGRNGGGGGAAGNGGRGGNAGSFSVFAEKIEDPTKRSQKIKLIMQGGKGGSEGLSGRGGSGGRGTTCEGKSKAGGTSGDNGDWGRSGEQGASRTQQTWLYENVKAANLMKSGNDACSCIKAMNYTPESKRILNSKILNCFNQNVISLQTTLSSGASASLEVSKEAMRIYMLNACSQEYNQVVMEEENNQLTLPPSGDLIENAVAATCQCITNGNSLAACQKAIIDLNEERIRQQYSVANVSVVQSDFSLKVTLTLLDVCDAVQQEADLSVFKNFSPVTENCAATISGDFLNGEGIDKKTISFDKQSFAVKSAKEKEEYSLQWKDCVAQLICLKTNSDKTKKGDKHNLTIVRASDYGFMGVYETPASKELVHFKARPKLTDKELTYLGQRYFIGQKVSINGKDRERPIQHIQYFDPLKSELVTIPEDTKVEGSIKHLVYNKKLDCYWIAVDIIGEKSKEMKSVFIDVEGAYIKKEFTVE